MVPIFGPPCILRVAATSSTSDQSFELCQFKDDPLPLGSRIHSSELKTLTSTSSSLYTGRCTNDFYFLLLTFKPRQNPIYHNTT